MVDVERIVRARQKYVSRANARTVDVRWHRRVLAEWSPLLLQCPVLSSLRSRIVRAVLFKRTICAYAVLMKRMLSTDLLREKLAEALSAPVRALTPRDIRLPAIAGKALAIIGVRRGGKTSFLQRRMADRIGAGAPRESQLMLSLEDERLTGMTGADLGWMLEEHERMAPGLRESGLLCLYLDEIQTVPGWELLVRRLIDSGGIRVFVSGSSAKLLSREVATSLRGRAMEVVVHPFSFRETLRHSGREPEGTWDRLPPTHRLSLDAELRAYSISAASRRRRTQSSATAHPYSRATSTSWSCATSSSVTR